MSLSMPSTLCVVTSVSVLTATVASAQTASTAGQAPGATGEAPPSVTSKTMENGPSEVFGAPKQIAVSSDAALVVSSASTSGVTGSTTTVQLHPALDYFVVQNISVGGFLGVDYSKTGDSHATRFGLGPRVGYNIGVSDLVSVWPKIGFSYSSTSTSTTISTPVGPQTGSVAASSLALNLYVPIMFHPAKHFFGGFGPFLDTDLSGDVKQTVFGAKLTVGGWL